ncbi:FmdE family protein [Thermodesulfobacteriota bacterium]
MQVTEKTQQEPTICSHSYSEYLQLVRSFHGHLAPGMILGGFMVDAAYRHLPEDEVFDVLCETRSCLPDAIQILTPCTVGNGWLRIIDIGRYALTLFEKYGGVGIRVFMDPPKLEPFPELKNWFFKLRPKQEQDFDRLLDEIRKAGATVCSFEAVRIDPDFIRPVRRKGFTLCPACQESYPSDDGPLCRGCQGQLPYLPGPLGKDGAPSKGPPLKAVPVEEAAGMHALHDMTQIIPGKEKGAAFKRNQPIATGDICRLQKMGRQAIYVSEVNPEDPEWVHEDEAARALGRAMAGEGVTVSESPREGKIELLAARNGLLLVDDKRMDVFNLLPDVKCASRHGFTVVSKGYKVAGTRAIPLYIRREAFDKAMALLNSGPLFRVLTMRRATVGILVTGTEIFMGLVEDRFIPIIQEKVEAYGCRVVKTDIVPDDREAIRHSVRDLLADDVDLLVTTAGLSVDPDDVTRQGLFDAGVVDLRYGAPILPGNMTLLARIGRVQVIGVPACALYHKTTSFDLLLPRLLAGIDITSQDLTKMGHGSLCLECATCEFPRCPFGK